jgi:Xaa-Pro aminopeptidase
MLTAVGCAARRKRLWDSLGGACDTLIVADPQHLTYFANLAIPPLDFRANDAGAILVLRPDSASLIGDNLLLPYLDRCHVDEIVAPVWYEGKRSAPDRRALLTSTARDVLRPRRADRIGIESARVPAGLLDGMRPPSVEIAPAIRRLRRVKDPDELDVLRRSMAAADAGFAAGLAGIEPGMTELEAFLIVQRAAIETTGESVIVYGDFVSGPRCEQIGGPATRRVIEPGDLVLLDFSVVVHGYRGDYANTFVAGGRSPTSRQAELFGACLEALAAGEAALKPGVEGRAVDAAVRESLSVRGPSEHFPGHSGHGVGLSHPEPPFFVPLSEDRLEVGDVVTLEPGQYVPGVAGMRYERTYRITDDGFERLSGHLLAIERPGSRAQGSRRQGRPQ